MSAPRLEILNVRLGFANNSSSSHSMILLAPNQEAPGTDTDGTSFNWNNFTLSDREAKLSYLAAQLHGQLTRDLKSPYLAARFIRGLIGEFGDFDYVSASGADTSVDHQSAHFLPYERDGKTLHRAFIKEYAEWLADPRLVILGGNDNDEDGHPLKNIGASATPHVFDYDASSSFIAQKDEDGTWTFFNPASGGKFRFRMVPGQAIEREEAPVQRRCAMPALPESESSERSEQNAPTSRPQLVDIKITDRCGYGCAYCYQGSTPKGEHATLPRIALIAYELSKAGTFEVAIGGGEPTSHPDFPEILRVFKAYGIAPNFTTRNMGLFSSPRGIEILKNSSSFAFSVDTLEQAKAAQGAWEKLREKQNLHTAMSIQVVAGAVPTDEIAKIIAFANDEKSRCQATVLGYKTTGFGAAYAADPAKALAIEEGQTAWISATEALIPKKQYASFRVSIDTALAMSCQKLLDRKSVSRKLYHTQEGSVSCYIDAVAGLIGPSSYCEASAMRPFDDAWLDTYRSFCAQPAKKRSKA